jgi:hypothetical protein
MMNQFSYINNRTEETIRAILTKEQEEKAANKPHKNERPVEKEEPTEIEGRRILCVSYLYTGGKLRIKGIIYDKASSDNKDNTTSLSLRFAQ